MSKKRIDEATGVETVGHSWDGIEEPNNPLPRWWHGTADAQIVFAIAQVIGYRAHPLARKGPGIHHTAYRCADVASAIAACRSRGLRLIDERPRRGIRDSLVAFIHPASTGGVLTELVQPAEGAH